MPDTPPPESPTPNETDVTESEQSIKSPTDTDIASPMEHEESEQLRTDFIKSDKNESGDIDDSFNEPIDDHGEDSKVKKN